jgi:dATP pyrophosphohydrolase
VSTKRPESVVAVVHTRDAVLLLERADWPGFWQSVTGSLAPNEDARAAAVRELREETGLTAAELIDCNVRRRFPIPPERRARYPERVTDNLEHAFRLPCARRPRVRLNPGEHRACVWRPLTEAARAASSWTNRAAIRSLPLTPRAATVVLVHGLWMGPAQTSLLAARLRGAGFATRTFGYSSTRQTPGEAAAELAALIERLETPAVHLVGHSLGGLVIAQLLAERVPAGRG